MLGIRLCVVEDGFRFEPNIRCHACNAVTFIAYPIGGEMNRPVCQEGSGRPTKKRRPQGIIKPISHTNQALGKAF
jgi:hypothetical protein